MITLTWFQKGQLRNELNKYIYICLVRHPHIVFHWFMKRSSSSPPLLHQSEAHKKYLFNWVCFNNLSVANYALFLSTIPCQHAIGEFAFIRICKRSALPFMWLNVDLFYKLPHCHNLHGFPSDFLKSDSFLESYNNYAVSFNFAIWLRDYPRTDPFPWFAGSVFVRTSARLELRLLKSARN